MEVSAECLVIVVGDAWVVSSENVHVVFVDYRGMVGDWSWNMIGVSSCLHISPLMSTVELLVALEFL